MNKKEILNKLESYKNIDPHCFAKTDDWDKFSKMLKNINVDVDNLFDDCGLMTVDDILNKYQWDMEELESKINESGEGNQELKDNQHFYKHDQEQSDIWYKKLCDGNAPYMYVPMDATYTPMLRNDFANIIINYLK